MIRKLLLALALMAAPAYAIDFHVAVNGGNDARTCAQAQSALTPRRTVLAGLACVTAGNRLILHEGTYSERLNLRYGSPGVPVGTSFSNAITIKAATGETVTLTYTSGDMIFGLETDSYPTRRSFYYILEDLIFDGAHAVLFPIGGLFGDFVRLQNVEVKNGLESGILPHGNSWELLNVHAHHNASSGGGHGLYWTGSNLILRGGSYDNNYGYGIHIYESGISSNNDNLVDGPRIFHNNWGSGGLDPVHPDGGAGGCIITSGSNNVLKNALIYDNRRYGCSISESGGSTNNQLLNNTFWGNTDEVYIGAGATGAIVKNNIIWGTTIGQNTVTNAGSASSISSNFTSNPSFVDTVDFKLAANSPAIRACAALAAVTTDFDGTTRPNPPSCGAREPSAPQTPAITVANPAQGNQNTTINVAVTGVGTHFVNGTSVCSFSGAGIAVNSTTVASATAATCNITIDVAATLSQRNVTVTTTAEVATKASGFRVFGPPTPPAGLRTVTDPSIATPGIGTPIIGRD